MRVLVIGLRDNNKNCMWWRKEGALKWEANKGEKSRSKKESQQTRILKYGTKTPNCTLNLRRGGVMREEPKIKNLEWATQCLHQIQQPRYVYVCVWWKDCMYMCVYVCACLIEIRFKNKPHTHIHTYTLTSIQPSTCLCIFWKFQMWVSINLNVHFLDLQIQLW